MSRISRSTSRFATVRDGDERAFRALVESLTPAMLRHAGAIVGDGATAQDVVQQAFVRIWRVRRQLPTAAGQLRSYCFRAAVRLALDHLKLAGRRAVHESTATTRQREAAQAREHERGGPAGQAAAREVWEMAMQLPGQLRDVLVLRYGCGLSLRETATALAVPEGTVSTWQRTGLERLRDRVAVSAGLAAPAAATLLERALAGAANTGSGAPQPTASLIRTIVEASVMASTVNKPTGLVVALLLLLVTGGVVAWNFFADPPAADELTPSGPRAAGPAEPGPDAPAPVPVVDDGDPLPRPIGQPEAPADGLPSVVRHQPASSWQTTDRVRTPAPGPADPDVPTCTLVGRVTDSLGRPVEQARLFARPVDLQPWDYGSRLQRSHQTSTDAAGEFELDVPVAGEFDLMVHGPVAGEETGYVPTELRIGELVANEVRDLGALVLQRGGVIVGQVLDPHGSPVPGATVVLGSEDSLPVRHLDHVISRPRGTGQQTADSPGYMAVTDQHGTYRLTSVVPGVHTLTAGAPGFQPASLHGISVEPDSIQQDVHIRLAGSARLIIEVVDGRGTPIEDATVRWGNSLEMLVDAEPGAGMLGALFGGGLAATTSGNTATTGPDGLAVVETTVRQLRIRVSASGYGRYSGEFRVGPGETRQTVQLLPGVVVTGRVVDSAGQPRQGALVQLTGAGEEMRMFPGTGSDGRFRFESVMAGEVSITVMAPPMPGTTVGPRVARAGETLDVGDVVMATQATLEVTVLDADGKPVRHADVQVSQGHRLQAANLGLFGAAVGDMVIAPTGRTGSDGVATLQVAAGDTVSVSARIARQPAGYAEHVRLLPGTTTCTVRLPAATGSISGVVTDATGHPAIGARVSARRVGFPSATEGGVTDANGVYTIANLAAGEWEVGSPHPEAGAPVVTVVDNQEMTANIVAGGSQEGRVRICYANGQAAVGLRVDFGSRIKAPDGSWTIGTAWSSATTDADGEVATYGRDFRVTTPDGAFVFGARPDGASVHLPDLARHGRVAVSVAAADAGSLEGATIALERAGPDALLWRRMQPAGDGSAVAFDTVPEGDYRAVLSGPAIATEVIAVEVVHNGVASATLSAGPAGHLEVHLVAPDGSTGAGATVRVAIAGEPDSVRTTDCAIGGTAGFASLRLGATCTVDVLDGSGQVAASRTVVILPGAVTTCTITVALG